MHPELGRLRELKAKDLELLGTDLRLKAVAEEIAGLDAALERARADVEAARRRVADGVKKRTDLETVIETQRTQQERRRSRIELVRTVPEVQALMAERHRAGWVLAREEGDWVKAAETNQQQESALQEAEERLGALEQDQSGERGRLAGGGGAVEGERGRARAETRPPGPPRGGGAVQAPLPHPLGPLVNFPPPRRRRPARRRRLRRLS